VPGVAPAELGRDGGDRVGDSGFRLVGEKVTKQRAVAAICLDDLAHAPPPPGTIGLVGMDRVVARQHGNPERVEEGERRDVARAVVRVLEGAERHLESGAGELTPRPGIVRRRARTDPGADEERE
jgi:hypothetical protein